MWYTYSVWHARGKPHFAQSAHHRARGTPYRSAGSHGAERAANVLFLRASQHISINAIGLYVLRAWYMHGTTIFFDCSIVQS